ncbi:MAG: HPr kinase/phosphorylase [Rhodothermales bacterium]|jgi:HPr kinase/phosphorylase
MPNRQPFKKESITVDFLFDQLTRTVRTELVLLNSVSGTERLVTESSLHRPGLALAGYLELFTYKRIQILGNTENQYLRNLTPAKRKKSFRNLLGFGIPCLILTENNRLDAQLTSMATEAGIPVFATPLPSTHFMAILRDFLSDQFALQQSVHGALVDVYGIGLLITGAAGIGKSEVALDLVERGHRLVADDVVIVTRKEEQVLMGAGTSLVQHFMEIRGLGLIDVRAMFGVRAIRFQKRVELVVHLHPWDPDIEYTRLGMVDKLYDLMGVHIPLVELPITTGKNVTVLCEVIAMNHILGHYGYDAATVFSERLAQRIKEKKEGKEGSRGIEYFEHDYE